MRGGRARNGPVRRIRWALVAAAVAGMLAGACANGGGEEGAVPEPAHARIDDEVDTAATNESGSALGPLVAGTTSVLGGVQVWTDYVYDDRGANRDGGDRTDLTSAGGDVVYEPGFENSADFVQVQLARSDDVLELTVVLETLTDPAVPLVGFGFDTDDDAATGAATLPGDAWSPSVPLGLEAVAVLGDGLGEVLRHTERGWERAEEVDVVVDTEDNTVRAQLPLRSILEDPSTFRVYAVIGPRTPAGSWYEGGGEIHDLAFVGDEPAYQWQDYIQADILGGEEPPGAASALVDLETLGSGRDRVVDELAPGFHTFLYHSQLDLGEGIRTGDVGREYLGPYQPYLVYLPEDARPDGALSVFLHGLSQNHLGSVGGGTEPYVGTARPLSEELHLLAEFAPDGVDFTPHNMTVWPLARGEALYYEGIAEQDVLDVLEDARRRLSPDPDRIILTGASMGGIGAFRLGALYPDRFSVVAPIIGMARDDVVPLLGNLHNTPVRQVNGSADPLIPAARAEASTDALQEAGVAFRSWMLEGRGHEAGGHVYDCVYASLPELRRHRSPTHVRYTVDPAMSVSDDRSGLELLHEGAYWVSAMQPAGDDLASVDLRSAALGEPPTEDEVADDTHHSGDGGRDLCGPNQHVRTGDTWRERSLERVPRGPVERDDMVEGRLRGLEAVTFDLGGAGLDPARAASLELETDTDVRLTVTGRNTGTQVHAASDGPEGLVGGDGSVTLQLSAGSHTIELE